MNMNLNPMMQQALQRLQSDPKEFLRQAGVNVPEGMMNDPQAMVMHLIRTGQVRNPMMQQMIPMLQRMGIK